MKMTDRDIRKIKKKEKREKRERKSAMYFDKKSGAVMNPVFLILWQKGSAAPPENVQCHTGFLQLSEVYRAPFFIITTHTVISRIRISEARLQLSIYSRSSFRTSRKSVISLRPLTCHRPVRPGLILKRRR